MSFRWILSLWVWIICFALWWYYFFAWQWENELQTTTWSIERPENIVTEIVQNDSNAIFALGDSLTAWYRLPLEDSYPSQLSKAIKVLWFNYEVINGGKSWDTSAGLLERLDWIVADAKAGDIAILVIGANDWFQSLSLVELEKNISSIVEELLEKNIRVVLWWMQIPTNLDPAYRASFAAIYPRVAQKYKLWLIPFFLENVAARKDLNLPDGIHPTKEWYEIISEQVLQYLINSDLLSK